MALKDLQVLAGEAPPTVAPDKTAFNPFLSTQQETPKKGNGLFSGLANALEETGKTIGNFGIGVAKSFIKLPQGAAKFGADLGLRAAAAMRPDIDYEQLRSAQKGSVIDQATETPEWMKAHGTAQEIGENVGDIAQFLIPVGGEGKLAKMAEKAGDIIGKTVKTIGTGEKTAKIATKAGEMAVESLGEGAKMAAQTGVQSGNADETEQSFILGSTVPIVGAAVKGAGKLLSEKSDFAGRIIDSLIKPLKQDVRYGQNPGETVAKMGITGNNMEELTKNITEAKNKIGKQIRETIEKHTSNAPGGLSLNFEDIVEPFDKAMNNAAKGGRTNQELINRLNDAKDAILNIYALDKDGNMIKVEPRNLSTVSLSEAMDIKEIISDITKWTQNESDDNAVNAVLKKVYRKTSDKMVAAVPELKDLDKKYSDLVSAENAAKYRSILERRTNILKAGLKTTSGVTSVVGALLGGGIGAGVGLASGVALEKSLESPAVLTRLAAWLAKAPTEEKRAVFNAYPAVLRAAQKLIDTNQPTPAE
jgi:hypothetical protein